MSKTQVIGLKELGIAFDKVLDAVDGDGLAAALLEGGVIVQNDAKRRVPRRSGDLAESIEIRVMGKERGEATVAVGPGPVDRPINKRDAFYQHFVEFGTTHHPAAPFMRPAFDENRRQIEGRIGEELRRRIEKAAR